MTAIIGTAGWSIPSKEAALFDPEGTALRRYASRFSGVEINSSFYRPHYPSTWARWADSVPPEFRFAVKVPKAITHERKLLDCSALLSGFLAQVGGLGPKLAVLLVQLPPKLAFKPLLTSEFFGELSPLTDAQLVCEPRHPSWFCDEAETLLDNLRVARVAADPALSPRAELPGGWRGLRYWRLHGSPIRYRSPYGADRLAGYAEQIGEERQVGRRDWCIFDNTASSAAVTDALTLQSLLRETKVARVLAPAR